MSVYEFYNPFEKNQKNRSDATTQNYEAINNQHKKKCDYGCNKKDNCNHKNQNISYPVYFYPPLPPFDCCNDCSPLPCNSPENTCKPCPTQCWQSFVCIPCGQFYSNDNCPSKLPCNNLPQQCFNSDFKYTFIYLSGCKPRDDC